MDFYEHFGTPKSSREYHQKISIKQIASFMFFGYTVIPHFQTHPSRITNQPIFV